MTSTVRISPERSSCSTALKQTPRQHHHPRSSAAVAVLVSAMTTTAIAGNFSFSSLDSGFSDNSRVEFEFYVSSDTNNTQNVTVRTLSYAGGTNSAGELIPAGGFDPILTVFDAQGSLVAYDDDGASEIDPSTGSSYDALLSLDLTEGSYQVVLTEFANFYDEQTGTFSGNEGDQIAGGDRTPFWAVDILGVESATFLGLINPGGQPGDEPGDEPDDTPAQEAINAALQTIAFNPNTGSTAAVISTGCPQSAAGSQFREDCTPIVLGALSDDSELNAEATAALAAVTDEEATVSLSSSRASMSSQLQNLTTRLSALRAGATGLSLGGLAFQNGLENADFPFAQAMQATGGAASADGSALLADERLGAFVNGTVTRADKDATTNESGFDSDSWSITGGMDYRFLDNLVAGIAVGYFKNTLDIDNSGGDLETTGYSFSLYGTYYQGENFYVDGIVSYGNNDYDQSRNIRYRVGGVGVSQTADASYGGEQWSAALGVGYDLSKGPWTYGPVARLEYVSADVDSYRESISSPNAPGASWAARVGDMNQTSLTSTLGGNLSRAVSTEWGVLLPQLHLAWVHEYEDDAVSVNGSFIADPVNSVFTITADRPDTDYFNGRLSVSAQLAGGTSAFLFYNKVFGYRDLDVDTVGAGVRLTF